MDGILEETVEEDIQKKRLPEVPLEESACVDSLLQEAKSGMLTENSNDSSRFLEFGESTQVSPASFLAQSGKEVCISRML